MRVEEVVEAEGREGTSEAAVEEEEAVCRPLPVPV